MVSQCDLRPVFLQDQCLYGPKHPAQPKQYLSSFHGYQDLRCPADTPPEKRPGKFGEQTLVEPALAGLGRFGARGDGLKGVARNFETRKNGFNFLALFFGALLVTRVLLIVETSSS